MNYLNLELDERQKSWYKACTDRFDHGDTENKAIEDSMKVAHGNAISILEDEFKKREERKDELIIFDIEITKEQVEALPKTDNANKKFMELKSKIKNREHSIVYIHYRLLDIIDGRFVNFEQFGKLRSALESNKDINGVVFESFGENKNINDVLFDNLGMNKSITEKALYRILNKFLLNILKEEQLKSD